MSSLNGSADLFTRETSSFEVDEGESACCCHYLVILFNILIQYCSVLIIIGLETFHSIPHANTPPMLWPSKPFFSRMWFHNLSVCATTERTGSAARAPLCSPHQCSFHSPSLRATWELYKRTTGTWWYSSFCLLWKVKIWFDCKFVSYKSLFHPV